MKIGFIGTGNMARAMIGGICASNQYEREDIIIAGRNKKNNKEIADKYGVVVRESNIEVAKESDILILAVKPYVYNIVIKEIENELKKDVIIVSIAAGISHAQLNELFSKSVKIVRTMPNTPSLIGEGMSAICFNEKLSEDEMGNIQDIFQCFGRVELIEEKNMHSFIGVSGSSPAYVYMFIEALADGAVLQGMPREKAYKMAAQAVVGAGKMVLETGEHPGKLKDNVCSPGGTTIEAVFELERLGLRKSVISAVKKCAEKSKDMEK